MRRNSLIALIALAALFVAADDPVRPRYRFAIDQPYRVRVDYSVKGVATHRDEQGETPQPVTSGLRSIFVVRGDSNANGFAVTMRPEQLAHVFAHGADTQKVLLAPGVLTVDENGTTRVDIRNPEQANTPIGAEYTLLQRPVVLSTDDRGRVTGTEGLDRWEKLLPRVNLTETLRLLTPALGDPASGGNEWTAPVPLDLPHCPADGCAIDLSYRIAGEEKVRGFDCVAIDVNGKADLAQTDFTGDPRSDIGVGADTRYTYYYQTVKGRIAFALQEGIVVESKLESRLNAHLVFRYAERAEPVERPMEIELAAELDFAYDGEKQKESLGDRLRRLLP